MTTSVGSIRLDLEIDGTAVPAEIQAAVTRALEPVLANIERRLNEIEREYGQTARAGERSGAKQSAAAKVVAEAVEKIGDEQVKTAAKTEASTRSQTRSINAVTRALEKQSLATEKATAAQLAYNAAVRAQPSPNYSPPPGTPRSGGGGGGGRGGRGGGFFGIGGPVTGALGWNGVAAVVGSFPAAATAVVNLTGAVQQLGQAGLVLPGIFAGIASSVGTAVIGFQGMGDAITALADAAKSGDLKDLEKANEALKDLAPSAQATAKAIATSVIPAFKDLQKNFVAQPMFEGLDQTITTLATRSMPTLQKGLGGIATAWNQTFKQLGITLGSDSSQGLLDRILGNTGEAQTRMNKAIEPLVHGFGTLTAKATDFLPRIADGFGAVMTRFDNWITKSAENGNLDKWINQGIDAASHLGESFLNVGKIITSLTKAAGGDGGLLKWLDEASGKLATFLNSDAGQAKLTAFFEEGKEQLRQWGPILGNVATIIGNVYSSMKDWSSGLLPVLQSVTGILAEHPGLIQDVATAFLAWKTIDGVTSLVSKLGNVGTILGGLPGKAETAAGGMNKAFSLIVIPELGKMLNDSIDEFLKENFPDLDKANHTNTPGDLGKQVRDAWDAWYEEHILGQGPFGEGHTLGPLGGGPNASRERRGLYVPPPLNLDDLPNVVTGEAPVPGMTPASLPTLSGLLTGKNDQLPPVPGQSPMSPNIPTIAPTDMPDLSSLIPPDLPKQIEIPVTAPGAVQAAQDVRAVDSAADGLPTEKKVTVTADTSGALSKLQGVASTLASIQSKTITVGINQTVSGSSTGSLGGLGGRITGRAAGGPIWGGIPGLDSVPVLAMPGEHMLTTSEVNAGGGHSGIYRLRAMLRAGWFKGMEAGGAVDGTPPSFGLSPLATDIAAGLRAAIQPMLGLLAQIRDNIGGRGGGYGPSTTDTVLASSTTQATGAGAVGPLGGSAGDYKSYPLGDPRRIMAGVMSGIGMPADEIAVALGGNMLSAAGGPVSDIVGDIATNVLTTPLPGQIGTPTNPSTDLNTLVQQRNPLALAQAAGFDVPDYTRAGGGPQDIMRNTGPASDAMGRMYSDTASLVDRTFTNLDAAEKARHDQTMTVLNEVKDRLGKDGLVPVLKEGVADGMGAMADKTTAAIGTSLGAAAGPPIASAVQSAIPSGSGAAPGVTVPAASDPTMGGGGLPPSAFHSFGSFTGFEGGIAFGNGGILGGLYDEGGLWPSGTFGTNLSGRPERVLSPEQTEAFEKGLLGGWNLYPLQQHMATVSGVDVTDQVGADFFGVSQVPILGALVNLLVMVLLRVIGVQIEARDTLDEISSDFRAFRGEFQAFDAAGRMMNDTSGLMDRTGSSEQAAADERVRILKLVLEGLIKFIIEKIIVPVGKAVANAAIQAGATAANGAITGGLTAALPTGGSVIGGMVGSVVSGAITAGGSAAVDIIADIGAKLGEAALSVLIDASGELLQGMLPNLTKFLFGGKFIAGIADSFTGALSNIMGGIGGVFAGLLGGIADLWPFDDGGIANGMGWLPKATVAPERVLSPRQTEAFEQMVAANFGNTTAGYNRTVHAPMTVIQAGPNTAHEIKDRLVSALS